MKINASNITAAVQRLIDEADIKRVISEYAHHLDGADPENLVGLFTDNMYVAYGRSHGANNPDEYLQVLGNDKTGIAAFFAATSHHVSNIAIDFIDEDTAKVRSVLLAWHKYNRDRPNGILYGQYLDEFRRVDGEWKIARREQITAGTDNYHAKEHTLVPVPRKTVEG